MISPDFTLVDEILKFEHKEYIEDREVEEVDDYDVFKSNARQAELREAARSGDYDTIMAAGTISSSKTIGIAAIITELCIEYPETLVLVVRDKRQDLEDKTIPDFKAVAPHGYTKPLNKSNLNQPFFNGSMIMYRAAREQEDRLFGWLKGLKPDIIYGNECDGFSREFWAMAQSRVGVQRKRTRRDIPICPPLAFMDCNPNISWPKEHRDKYTDKPQTMKPDRFYFLKFTIQDNSEYITPAKIAQWKRVFTPPMYRRFVEGSWDAMSDLEQLFLFEDMDKCRNLIPEKPGEKFKYYLGVDPARFGPDKCAFLVMHGPNRHRIDWLAQSSIPDITFHVKQLMTEYAITPDHITCDVIGLGAGVVDNLGAEHIWINAHNGAMVPDDAAFYHEDPTNPESKINMDNAAFSFLNKRAQSHWEVMQLLRAGKLGGIGNQEGYKGPSGGEGEPINVDEILRQDMAAIHYGFAKGSKAIKIEDKEEIKKRLHRSPDFSDVLVMAVDAYLHDLKKPSMEVHVF